MVEESILWTAGILSALAIIVRYLVKPIFGWVRLTLLHYRQAREQLEYVHCQLSPNGGEGGGNLFDTVKRISGDLSLVVGRIRALSQASTDAVVETDAEGKVTWVNRAFYQALDCTESDVLGDAWMSLIHPEDREMLVSGWEDAVARGIDYHGQYRYLLPDGRVIPVTSRTSAIKHDGNIIGHLGVIHFPEEVKGESN